MNINLNTGEGLTKRIIYPDGQPHINFNQMGVNSWVICSLVDSKRLLELLMVADILKRSPLGMRGSYLHLLYLMGARFDRIMEKGDSFDLKIIANLINSCGFGEVHLYDPHSDVAPALIENSVVHGNRRLVSEYKKENAVLIIPDGGASKKAANYPAWNSNIVDTVQCVKHRNLSTGEIVITVLEPEKCKDRNCIIIDDICDGGGTFLGIAAQIEPAHLTLMVTHGIFSKGFDILGEKFDHIITTNSYPLGNYPNYVTAINAMLL